MSEALAQMILPLRFDQSYSFDNFYDEDEFVLHALVSAIQSPAEHFVLISGGIASGKTHLINASAAFCQKNGIAFQYFNAEQLMQYGSDIITACSESSVLLIDDIQLLAGNSEWERKLYDLYNESQRENWIFIAACKKDNLASFELKDLCSRLDSGFQLTLDSRDETTLKKIIEFRTHLLGLSINKDVLNYLFSHYPRDLKQQLNLIKKLSERSLVQKRKLTIPFIKATME
ncbi:MAG: hypothetical protein ISR69_02925 [Gammaproteobacteria bacterium]|nr:hypothetical protein [Gammaproteobacteria bacterium]